MSILSWVAFGWLAGWIAARLMKEKQGCVANVVVGMIGALLGGFLFTFLGSADLTGFNPWSLLVAVIGAIVFIAVLRLLRGERK